MHDHEIVSRLTAMREGGYPLAIDVDDAEALVACIDRIMSVVPEDDVPLVRGDYDLATSAMCHPEPNEFFGTSNEQLR